MSPLIQGLNYRSACDGMILCVLVYCVLSAAYGVINDDLAIVIDLL